MTTNFVFPIFVDSLPFLHHKHDLLALQPHFRVTHKTIKARDWHFAMFGGILPVSHLIVIITLRGNAVIRACTTLALDFQEKKKMAGGGDICVANGCRKHKKKPLATARGKLMMMMKVTPPPAKRGLSFTEKPVKRGTLLGARRAAVERSAQF